MREQSTPAGTGPRRVKASLDRLSRTLGGLSAGVWERVFTEWPNLVGPAVAEHVHPVSLRREVLVVSVDDPAWGAELRYRGAGLLKGIGEHLGPGAPTRLEVRVRPRGTRAQDPPVVE